MMLVFKCKTESSTWYSIEKFLVSKMQNAKKQMDEIQAAFLFVKLSIANYCI